MHRFLAIKDGLVLCFCLGLLALTLGRFFPLIDSNLFALAIGIFWVNTLGIGERFRQGLAYCSKTLLQYAMILLGFGLSIQEVSQLGLASLPLTMLTISIAFGVAFFIGKKLGLAKNLASLIGFGTAICGGSAILSAAPVLEASDDEIALSLSTIFCFNILAILVFPLVGRFFKLSDSLFGLWAGTAVNDTSSVLAVAYSYSQQAGDYATIVKLARSLMIIPICLIFAAAKSYQSKGEGSKFSLLAIFPWFIVWFLLASLIRSMGWVPSNLLFVFKDLSRLLMGMALVAVGSKVSLSQLQQAGLSPFFTGLFTWLAVAASSLLLQYFLY